MSGILISRFVFLASACMQIEYGLIVDNLCRFAHMPSHLFPFLRILLMRL